MYQGFFVNLARNQDRRMALTRHLAELGAASLYRRIEAVDGRAVAHQFETSLDPGALGLWLTHLKLLQDLGNTSVHLHIIEDDTILSVRAPSAFDNLLSYADEKLLSLRWTLELVRHATVLNGRTSF